jgi:hypothetical protein
MAWTADEPLTDYQPNKLLQTAMGLANTDFHSTFLFLHSVARFV